MSIINSGISTRNLFIISMTSVVIIMTAGIAVLAEIDLAYLSKINVKTAQKALHDVLDNNYRLSERILTYYGKKLVEFKARETAARLSMMFRDLDTSNYSALRLNKKLREIATQPIYANDIQAGYLDLIDNTGEAVLHPNKAIEGRNFSQWAKKYPDMWRYVKESFHKKIVKGFYNFFDLQGRVRKKYMVLVQVEGTPFIAIAAVQIDDFFLPVQKLIRENGHKAQEEAEKEIIQTTDETSDMIKNHALIWGCGLLICCILVSFRLAILLTRPITELKKGVVAVGRGELGVRLQEKGPSEIIELARVFNMMEAKLNDYIERVRKESAARQAIESEIAIAANIQESLLPRSFPPFPDNNEFSLRGVNIAAREVGGDFYDFFFLDDENLAIIIGDVSGKGIPAALFMAVTRTLFRIICTEESDPAEAMARVNRTLCRDNDACMFVTVFLGYYNIKTGRLLYANGGHPDGIIVSPDGECMETRHSGSIILGIEPDASYVTMEADIKKDHILFLYTDGITEACRDGEEFFGEEKLRRYLGRTCARLSVDELCSRLVDELERFQKGEQFDDITMLVLKREI